MHDLPAAVRNKVTVVGAEAWLAGLEELIADLERDWSITIGRTFGAATEAFVAEALLADGTPAVVKLMMPRDFESARSEITVLRMADGEGCVRLLRGDVDRGAMLLERLGPSLFDLSLPLEQRHEILCATANRLWRPAPGCGLTNGAEKARWLAESITTMWEDLDRPCSERTIDHALDCVERRSAAHDDERAVLVHGDVHQWNTLQGPSGFKLVDPDGLLAEAEYDMGIVMREDPDDLLDRDPWERAHWLAARCALDATAIWEWGVIERVSTGLLGTMVDLQPVAGQMLEVAERIAR